MNPYGASQLGQAVASGLSLELGGHTDAYFVVQVRGREAGLLEDKASFACGRGGQVNGCIRHKRLRYGN
ncbi:MAG: hypothetical protein IPL78_28255 [Chloroflexi bacterium]|nr:hypothetical protein [Chloroflexota bacterium]